MAGNMKKFGFIARLLAALPDHQPGWDKERLTAWLENLPEEEQVSYRQIQRDLFDLEEIGWAARAQDLNGKKGDFWICRYQGTRIVDRKDMTRERAFALQLIQHKLRHLVPEQILKALETEFRLSSERLDLDGHRAREWMGKIGDVPNLLLPPAFQNGVFGPISEALLEDKYLDIRYRNKGGSEHEGRLMPLGLASKDGVYYLIGRYAGDGVDRQFRVDRILHAVMSDEPFVYPDDFRLIDYMDAGLFNYPSGDEFRLVVRIRTAAARHLQDTPLSEDQTLEAIDPDWMRLSATVRDSQRLHWWILGFGSQMVVEAPAELREMMSAHVRELMQHYAID